MRIFGTLTILTILLFFTMMVMSCENDLKEVNRVAGTAGSGSMETSSDGEIIYSDSAHLKVRIEYDTMIRFLDQADPKDVFPKGVIVSFYDDKEEISSILTANKAERQPRKSLIIATDSVHLVSKNGEELLTNELIWDELKKEVYTNKFVKLTRPGEIIYSFGFRANQEFTKYEIKAISGKLSKKNLDQNL